MTKAAKAHLRTDPVMAELIERFGPLPLKPRRLPPFQSLVHAVIHQQLSGKAAGSILARFLAIYGNGGFPGPEDLLKTPPESLRAAGLSRQKVTYLFEVAQKTREGIVPTLEECDKLTDAEIIERLTAIKGIGRWTVEMLLIFNLGRPDVLPVHDLALRRGFQIAHGKKAPPQPAMLALHGRRWAPHRTAAALYLWRVVDPPGNSDW